MRRRGRHVRVPPDLTSLFDVLFIVIFVALIRAAAAQQAVAAAATPAPAPPAVVAKPLDPRSLQARARVAIERQLAARQAIVVRVSAAGSITAIERAGKTLALDAPLLEQSANPDVAVAYLGDRSAELRVCRVAALHLGEPDLAKFLVIVAPDRLRDDLRHALSDGLERDVERCLAEQRGLAIIVWPEVVDGRP